MSSGKKSSFQMPPQQAAPQYGSAYQDSNTIATQRYTPWGPTAGVYGQLAGMLRGQAARGPQYVGPSNATERSWDLAIDAAQKAKGLANTGIQNYNFLSKAADVANNPYVQKMLATNSSRAMDTLNEQMLPALQSGALSVNNLGSSRLGLAQGQAIGDTQESLQNANNELMMGAYSQGLSAQQNALSSLGALQTAQFAPSLAYSTIGQQREAYQQERQDAPWRLMQNLGAGLQYLNPLGTLTGRTVGEATSGSGPQGAYGRGANPPAYADYNQMFQQQQQQLPNLTQPPAYNWFNSGGNSWYNQS